MLIRKGMMGKAGALRLSYHAGPKLFAAPASRIGLFGSSRLIIRNGIQLLSFHSSSKACNSNFLEEYKATIGFPKGNSQAGEIPGLESVNSIMVMHGYLISRKDMSKNMSFAELICKDMKTKVQIIGFRKDSSGTDNGLLDQLRDIRLHCPIVATGLIQRKQGPNGVESDQVEMHLHKIQTLNSFPASLVMSKDTKFLPQQRHLQIKYTESLRDALRFRSTMAARCRQLLIADNFVEIETPILFKSTPEGAREFLVPTRRMGLAYALPQSPQQYKQILMASGMPKYFQIARCFRDEDLRADRQPEFTQLDLEMAFSDEEDVMKCIEKLVVDLWSFGLDIDLNVPFPRMTYAEAMRRFGSDKPDVRLGMEIMDVTDYLTPKYKASLAQETPQIIEAIKVRFPEDIDEGKVSKFLESFSAELEARGFNVTIQDPSSPRLWRYKHNEPFPLSLPPDMIESFKIRDGDVFITLARASSTPTGGSTEMGRLRLATQSCLEALGLVPAPTGFKFLWVTDFPLVSPNEYDHTDTEHIHTPPYISTHHPFTAPKTPEDVDLLTSNPTAAIAAHYDLVVNGVELGGGSRRIHDAKVQEYVLREVLKLSDKRVEDFAHLLGVLETGCPPHAGIALGFDRLIAVMKGLASVRDVIAFPKSGSGEDPLVESPGPLMDEQLKTYHLSLREEHKD